MTLLKVFFAGYNGFGQFKGLPKIVDKFEDVRIDKLVDASLSNGKNIEIKCSWEYLAFSVDNVLHICGYMNGDCEQLRKIPFEYNIKNISCTEKYCLVLLSIGVVYKLNLQTFEFSEISSLIIQRKETNGTLRKNMFGNLTADQENSLNKMNDETITHIASGRSFSVAISNKNSVYNIPMKIFTFPSHIKIKKISCGNEHCLILTTNGDLYAFGSSSRGQLGLGELQSEEQPVLIEALAGVKIIDIAAGGWHSAAVSAFNDLYVWGWNVNGQLGLPLSKTYEIILRNGEKSIECQKMATVFATPLVIDLPKTVLNSDPSDVVDEEDDHFQMQHSPVKVYAGIRHTIIKTEDGTLLGAGWNKYGQLGFNDLDNDFDRFRSLNKEDLGTDVDLVCGDWCTIVISKIP